MQKGKFPKLLVNYLNVVQLLSDVNIMVGNGGIIIVLTVVNWRKSLSLIIVA